MKQIILILVCAFSSVAFADEAAIQAEKEKFAEMVLIMRDIREVRGYHTEAMLRDEWLVPQGENKSTGQSVFSNSIGSRHMPPISMDYKWDRIEDRLFEHLDTYDDSLKNLEIVN